MALLDSSHAYGWTTFCDDIRQEIGGKFCYIGVYNGFMVVHGTLPVTLPKFCLAITLLQRREILDVNIGLRIFLPGDEDDTPSIRADFAETAQGIIAEQTAEQAAHLPKSDFSYVAMHAKLIFSPFTITQMGDLRVRALRADDLIRLGAIRIIPPQPEAS